MNATIGYGTFVYHEERLSKTAQRDASRAANRLIKEFTSEPPSTDYAEEWLVESAREVADDRFDWDRNYEMHFRYREEIEHLFVDRMGGWDAITEICRNR